MKRDDAHRYLLQALQKNIPSQTKLVETLMDILCMEKGAIYRRLRGDVPFSFFVSLNISEKLDISLSSLAYADSERIDRFELNMVEYMNMSEADYKQWENYISLISLAKTDSHSEMTESSNVLPISLYGGFDSLSKYFLFKYQYMSLGIGDRTAFCDLIVPERLHRIHRSYFIESKNFARTIYIWDYLIFQYLVTDIRFFSSINLISENEIRQIKEDLFNFLNYVETIAFNGCFEETGNPVSFYISDVNLDADYSYVQLNDMCISLVRTFILNSVVSGNRYSYEKIKNWIKSILKSSTLITQSGTVYRAEFFEKQRTIISEL
jgi:hypothetical protein